MNARRGMFRLWVVVSILFATIVGAVSYDGIHNEFRATVKGVPVDCAKALGAEGTDYANIAGVCWYPIETFRRFYPEYHGLSDRVLSEKLWAKAGIPTEKHHHPWKMVFDTVALAFGIPLAILALGAGLGWAFAGFREEKNA